MSYGGHYWKLCRENPMPIAHWSQTDSSITPYNKTPTKNNPPMSKYVCQNTELWSRWWVVTHLVQTIIKTNQSLFSIRQQDVFMPKWFSFHSRKVLNVNNKTIILLKHVLLRANLSCYLYDHYNINVQLKQRSDMPIAYWASSLFYKWFRSTEY